MADTQQTVSVEAPSPSKSTTANRTRDHLPLPVGNDASKSTGKMQGKQELSDNKTGLLKIDPVQLNPRKSVAFEADSEAKKPTLKYVTKSPQPTPNVPKPSTCSKKVEQTPAVISLPQDMVEKESDKIDKTPVSQDSSTENVRKTSANVTESTPHDVHVSQPVPSTETPASKANPHVTKIKDDASTAVPENVTSRRVSLESILETKELEVSPHPSRAPSQGEGTTPRTSAGQVAVTARPFISRLLSNPKMVVADKPSSGTALWKTLMKKMNIEGQQSQTPVGPKFEERTIVGRNGRLRKMSGMYVTQGRKKSWVDIHTFVRRERIKKLFRRYARLSIFCMRCVKQHSFKFRENSELTPYIAVLSYMDYTTEQIPDLMFDPSNFRADQQMRMSEDIKRILSKPSQDRTQQEVYSAHIALRNIKSFAEFPARMQQKIAEVGHYEAYESKRVITREGHPPVAFYFLLSGAVVAMELDKNRSTAIPVNEFVKGDMFEENPMLHDTPRECTILTKEQCEFLSISAKDYKRIFMQGGVKNLNDPDQDSFLKSLSFLKGWPIHLLMDHPTKCQFLYFKRGAILARDTHYSQWIVIVKSGSLSVLKKLKKVGPYEWKRKNVIKPLTEREKRERKQQKSQWRRFILPELRLPLRKGKDVEEVEERIDGKPKPFQHPEIKMIKDEDDQRRDMKSKYVYPNLWTYRQAGDDQVDEATFSNINRQYLYVMKAKHDEDAEAIRAAASQRMVGRSKTSYNLLDPGTSGSPAPYGSPRDSLSSSPDPMAFSVGGASSSVRSSSYQSILEEFDSPQRPRSEGTLRDIDRNPQFVKVQTLTKGQVWGLADLILQDQPSFTVVSNGADCVLINKQFYEEHSSERLQRTMRQELCPYPTDDDLQQGLQVSVDWKEYRKTMLSSTLQVLNRRRDVSSAMATPQNAF